jgi:hypothetical protein
MIPKNKIKEAAELYTGVNLKLLVPEAEITNTAKDLYNYAISDFTDGVEFAEKELENLAIEFAEWIEENFYKNHRDKGDSFWMNSKKLNAYTTQELFEIFKQENCE